MSEEFGSKKTRRKILKTSGTALSSLPLVNVVGATPGESGKGNGKSEGKGRKPTEEEKETIRKKRQAATAAVRKDSKRVYEKKYQEMQDSDGVSTSDVIVGTVPSVGCDASYGSQYASWVNSNSSPVSQVGSFTNGYTEASSSANKAAAVSDAVALESNLWAWAETGLVFDTRDSGRLECTCNGYIRGQNYAQVPGSGNAGASTDFYLLGYNLTDGKVADGPSNGTTTIEDFGFNAFGTAKSKSRSYGQTLKLDVDAGKRYIFVAKIRASSFAYGAARGVADADEKYDAALTIADYDGYHQMYNMGVSYKSC